MESLVFLRQQKTYFSQRKGCLASNLNIDCCPPCGGGGGFWPNSIVPGNGCCCWTCTGYNMACCCMTGWESIILGLTGRDWLRLVLCAAMLWTGTWKIYLPHCNITMQPYSNVIHYHLMIILENFLFFNKNTSCGYSLEVTQRGTSNEYPQIYVFKESLRKLSQNYHQILLLYKWCSQILIFQWIYFSLINSYECKVIIKHNFYHFQIKTYPVRQLSISGERMYCPVQIWLGKLTALDMIPMGWLSHKTSTQTNISCGYSWENVYMSFTKEKWSLGHIQSVMIPISH